VRSLLKNKDRVEECHKKFDIFHNLNFQYTRRITPMRVTSLRCLSPRHSDKAALLLAWRCWSGGEPFASLCKNISKF